MNLHRRWLAVSQITRTELRRYLEDRIAIFTTVLMPVVLILLIGSAISTAPKQFVVGIIDTDSTALSRQLAAALDASDALDVRPYDDARELRRDIRLGQVSAGIVLPRALASEFAAGHSVELGLLTEQADSSAASVVAAVNGAVAEAGGRLAATRFVAAKMGIPPAEAADLVNEVAASVPKPHIETTTVGVVRQEEENAFTSAVISQLTLFVFANGLFAAAALVATRQLGVSRRALASPIGPGTLVAGIGGSRFALAFLQALLLLVVGAVMFSVDWGNLAAVACLVVVFCLVSAGAGMLLGALAKTADQAIAIAVPLAIGTAMLGGTMWPLDVVGPAMQVVGHLMPQSWAMDAWSAIVNDGAGVAGIATELVVLAGYAAAFLVLGAWAQRRALTR